MARTATKATSQETIPVTNPDADIRNIVHTMAATNSPDQLPQGAKTGDQTNEAIRPWLEQGFKVKTAQVIQAGDVNGIYILQVYFCLVKD